MSRKCTASCHCCRARALLLSWRLGLWACCIYFLRWPLKIWGAAGTGLADVLFARTQPAGCGVNCLHQRGGVDRRCVLKIYCLNPTSSHAIMVHVHTRTLNEPTHSKQVRTCSWSIPQPNAVQKISPLFLQLDGPLLLIMYVALLNLHEKR
jgi:hypothetical protein